jgi:hypothetical protein
MGYYDNGQKEQFFKLWKQMHKLKEDSKSKHSPSQHSLSVLKIEFYTSLYFCIYPLLLSMKLVQSNVNYKTEELADWYRQEIKAFKSYLDKNGAIFASTPEFLSYYALSYVENPIVHSSFNKLFQSSWVEEKRNLLAKFLEKDIPERNTTRLEKILYFFKQNSKVELSELWSKDESALDPVSRSGFDQGRSGEKSANIEETNTFSRERFQNQLARDNSQMKSFDITSPRDKNYEQAQLLINEFTHIKEVSIGLLD